MADADRIEERLNEIEALSYDTRWCGPAAFESIQWLVSSLRQSTAETARLTARVAELERAAVERDKHIEFQAGLVEDRAMEVHLLLHFVTHLALHAPVSADLRNQAREALRSVGVVVDDSQRFAFKTLEDSARSSSTGD